MGLGAQPSHAKDAQERHRLAELLFGREHPAEALLELDKIQAKELSADPSIRYVRARILDALARRKEAEPLVSDPTEVTSSYSRWWAIRGRWARERGDGAAADSSFVEAVAQDPFEVEAACEGLDLPGSAPIGSPGGRSPLLCDAARKIGEPPLGQD
jgi:hypothetical protein